MTATDKPFEFHNHLSGQKAHIVTTRLETMSPELALEINSASLSEAKTRVLAILVQKQAAMPSDVARLFPTDFEPQSYIVTQDQIDRLDDRYFDLEEKGEAAVSATFFAAARFLSAVMTYQAATNQNELCEAVYEAHFAGGQLT